MTLKEEKKSGTNRSAVFIVIDAGKRFIWIAIEVRVDAADIPVPRKSHVALREK